MEPNGTMKKFITKIKNIDWGFVGIMLSLIFMGSLPIFVYFGYLI